MNNSTDALRTELAGLRTDIQALTSGLTLMLEVQEAHGELLRQLGEALGQEPNGPSPIAEALERLVTASRDQSAALDRLSQRIAGATLRGVGSLDA